MRVSDALRVYLVQLEADGRSMHTIKQAQRHVRLFASWASDLPIADVGHELVARFLASDAVRLRADGGPREPTSSNTIRSSLRRFGAFCHAAAYVASDPTRLVRRARTRPPSPKALSESDMAKLMNALAQASTPLELRDRTMITLMARTGLRLGSLVALDIEDIDFDAGEIRVRVLKNGGDDVVVLPDDVAELLREHIGVRRSGPLFISTHGARIGARHVRRRLEQWGRRAGVASIHPHALRHRFAMAVYERTGDLLVTAAALCHRSVASTQVYARPERERVRAAMG
jgi:site-specific recombinase XerC